MFTNSLCSDPYGDLLKDHLNKTEKLKEERKKQNMEMELQRQRDQDKEVELKKLSQINKQKLLEDLAKEECRNDSKLAEVSPSPSTSPSPSISP